jgi:hypothetical protein
MEEEDVSDDAILVPLRTLMDIDTVVVPQRILSVLPAVALMNMPFHALLGQQRNGRKLLRSTYPLLQLLTIFVLN